MGAFLELVREATPEDRKAVAELLMPYLQPKPKQRTALMSLNEFKAALEDQFGINKGKNWLRYDLFCQCPALREYAYGLNAGKGHRVMIDPKALDWIDRHMRLIDWQG